MRIWKHDFTLELLNSMGQNTIGSLLGIEFTEFGDDFLRARMPADYRTVQPARIVHGGANVVLAETLGSVASVLCVDDPFQQRCVGLEVNASHLRAVPEGSGYVYGTCRPVRVGRKVHVWSIELHNERQQLTCSCRLTVAVL